MITIDVIRNFAALTTFRQAWEELLMASYSRSVFLTWEWVETWWQTYQSDFKLLILVAKKDGVPCGIAPLLVRNGEPSRLEFFGQNKAYGEYLDFLVAEGEETVVTPLLCKKIAELHRKGEWQSMNLALVLQGSPNQQIILDSLTSMGLVVACSPPQVSPYVELPSTWNRYLELKGQKLRKRIAYNQRRLSREGAYTVEYPNDHHEVDAFFDNLIQLHSHRWDTPVDEVFFNFHRQIAQRYFPLGRLLLARLRIGDKVLAVKYDFVFDNKVWGYQGGWLKDYAKLEVGSILLCEIFKHCIDQKLQVYDFLEGDDWYKRRWSTQELSSCHLSYGKAGPPFIF